MRSGSDEDEENQSDSGSHVWIPLRLLLGSSGSRKSRSGEGLSSHDGWFSFDIINIRCLESLVNQPRASLITGSSSEVSSNFSSGPGNDDVIVLVDGEGVISFVIVEDFHKVAVATNTVSSATLSDSESFNRFGSSGSDFGSLEEFDGFHGWFLSI